MALRAPAVWLGNPAVQHTAQNDRLWHAGLLRPEAGQTAANRPLTALSGVIAGPPGTMGEVTVLSNTQFTVNPARWAVYGTATALAGAYGITNDAVATLGITAQDGTQTRRSYFGVWTGDSFTAGSGDDAPHWGLIDGPLAPSNPQLPAAGVLPANFLALGEFLIPPTGQAVAWTPYDVRTGLRGAVLPVTATDTRAPAADGQVRWHPSFGVQAGKGGAWGSPQLPISGKVWASANATPASGVFTVVVMTGTRLYGGFTFDAANNALVIPFDGFYRVSQHCYEFGSNGSTAMFLATRLRAGATADFCSIMAYRASVDMQLAASDPLVPLLAGDRLQQRFYSYVAGSGYAANGEYNGCNVTAEYVGPLGGATAA